MRKLCLWASVILVSWSSAAFAEQDPAVQQEQASASQEVLRPTVDVMDRRFMIRNPGRDPVITANELMRAFPELKGVDKFLDEVQACGLWKGDHDQFTDRGKLRMSQRLTRRMAMFLGLPEADPYLLKKRDEYIQNLCTGRVSRESYTHDDGRIDLPMVWSSTEPGAMPPDPPSTLPGTVMHTFRPGAICMDQGTFAGRCIHVEFVRGYTVNGQPLPGCGNIAGKSALASRLTEQMPAPTSGLLGGQPPVVPSTPIGPGLYPVRDEEEDDDPFWKKPWFWGVVGAGVFCAIKCDDIFGNDSEKSRDIPEPTPPKTGGPGPSPGVTLSFSFGWP